MTIVVPKLHSEVLNENDHWEDEQIVSLELYTNGNGLSSRIGELVCVQDRMHP